MSLRTLLRMFLSDNKVVSGNWVWASKSWLTKRPDRRMPYFFKVMNFSRESNGGKDKTLLE